VRARLSGAFVVALGLTAGCGGQGPSTPSPLAPSTQGTNVSATQTIIAATISQATVNTAMTVSQDGSSPTVTFPCPDGGSMSLTVTSTPGAGASGTFTSSSRVEFTGCRSQTVTIDGDPAVMTEGTYTFSGTPGADASTLTSTIRMTGGLRFDAGGVAGRARYDCTVTTSMALNGNGTPTPQTVTSSGTLTWEQPLGTVIVRPCGP
jgi:hypothetical protein